MELNDHDHISLIDLSKQFPFDIDNELKKELCFNETLVVSCGHFKGDIGEVPSVSSDSEWSCSESTENEESVEVKDVAPIETQDKVEEEPAAKMEEESEDNFCFYFFHDCNKSIKHTKDSKASIITVDGIPKINAAKKARMTCNSDFDKMGKCTCFTRLLCKCGAKTIDECTCATPEEICVCHGDICDCLLDSRMSPECECSDIPKPYIRDLSKYPYPVCECKQKQKLDTDRTLVTEEQIPIEGGAGEGEQEKNESETTNELYACQKLKPNPICQCLRHENCICKKDACICKVQKNCVCERTESEEVIYRSDSNLACPLHPACTCSDEMPTHCECFPKPVCTCGDPENCKCQRICHCIHPCICDTKKEEECTCLTKDCLRKVDKGNKLKHMRVDKQGYRWCHDVDPRNTYFDYGYDRHDKISYKEEQREKIKILGLHEEKENREACVIHGVKAPPYERTVRQPSIDCCSAVGGLSICVETLGEDKDKFLVQMVSHLSKEGAKSGSKLVSILDCNLHTMEENRTEYISKKEIIKERRSYMTICDSGYYNKITRICGERHVVKRFYHSFEQAKNMLLEGANVVLLRYLGLQRYRGNIKTETVMIDGTICESIYVSLGVSQAIVNGKPLFVVKVERHIIEPNGFIHQTLTVLTLRGYIVSHEWADNCYILHLNPLLRIIPEKDEIEPHAPLREKWREDLQLMSDYLDHKSARSSEGARYVTENSALTGTIRDYLQALLLLKPQDALHFTRHYFGAALSVVDLPHDEYFDPSTKHVKYYFFEE